MNITDLTKERISDIPNEDLDWLLLVSKEYFENNDTKCMSLHFVKHLKDITGYSLIVCKTIYDLFRESGCIYGERYWDKEKINLITDVEDILFLACNNANVESLKYYKNLNLI